MGGLVEKWHGEVVEEVWYNRGMAYIRKTKTASGATAVQVCFKSRGQIEKIEHIGSANSAKGVKKLMKQARAVMDAGKSPLFDLSRFDSEKEEDGEK